MWRVLVQKHFILIGLKFYISFFKVFLGGVVTCFIYFFYLDKESGEAIEDGPVVI